MFGQQQLSAAIWCVLSFVVVDVTTLRHLRILCVNSTC
jgi:hypothetical protein